MFKGKDTFFNVCTDIISIRYASSSNSTIIAITTNNHDNNNIPYFFKYLLRVVICRCVGREHLDYVLCNISNFFVPFF